MMTFRPRDLNRFFEPWGAGFVVIIAMLCLAGCRGEARDSLRLWLQAWEQVRACMLPEEVAADSTAATAVRDLLVRDKSCEGRTTLMAIPERDLESIPGWKEAYRAAAFLPYDVDLDVIHRIDAQVAVLRERVDLPPITRSVRPLPKLPPGQRIRLGSDEVDITRVERLSSQGGRIHGVFHHGNHDLVFSIESPESVRWAKVPQRFALGFPSRTWAASAEQNQLTIVELPLGGRSKTLALPSRGWVAAAMDRGRTRMIVLQNLGSYSYTGDRYYGFAVAISDDDGDHWRLVPATQELPLGRVNQDPVTGKVDVVAETMKHWYEYRLEITTPFRFPEPRQIDRGVEGKWAACRGGDLLWMVTDFDILRSDRNETRKFPLPDDLFPLWQPTDCREDSALVETNNRTTVCREDGCRVVHERVRPVDEHAGALLEDGAWVHAAAAKDVVALWGATLSTPLLYRLEEGYKLTKIAMLRGTLYLLVSDGEQKLRLIPLPALPKNS